MLNAQTMQMMAMKWAAAQPAVAAFITSMVPDFHDGEDLIQRTAAAVIEKYEEYDPARPFLPWAIGIARREVLNYRRTRARDRHILNNDAIESVAAAYQDIHEAEWDDSKEALEHCLQRMQGRSRLALELRYLREMTPAAIAGRLSMNTNAVFVMLHRARAALRKCIERRLQDNSEVTP